MFNELTFVDGTPTPSVAYFGGNPFFPESLNWPVDSSGAPMLHVATFPAEFLDKYVPTLRVRSDLVVSVFSPYSIADDGYIDRVMTEGGVALAYRPSSTSIDRYGSPIAPPKLINVIANPEDDSEENGVAKIGGVPAWVQDEEQRDAMVYVLQLNNSRLNRAASTHKSILVGGIGYLLLKADLHHEDLYAGVLIIQTS
ncbi:hypothetical protein [Paraburkholderia sp. J94]|uniref:hypothetical protein n=1 Tax=Paraburkholderia sp. J94 TaxID=2805441 RepID=UPI002AAFEB62|nr:hypothetical protein [Paraburkholderia sp. J94]